MIRVTKEGVILRKTDFDFENESVLNPAIIREGDSLYLFYRAVRKGNYSSIGFCKLDGPLTVKERFDIPIMIPEFEYESHGIEDPRIVKIDDLYYMTYVAYNGTNALGALAISKDLKHFEKQGLIVPEIRINEFTAIVQPMDKVTNKYFTMNVGSGFLMNKDVVFFPRRINNKLYFMHRIKPEIQLVSVNSLQELTKEFWENYFNHFDENIMLKPRYSQELSYIGAGCPPIETNEGWLLIYHGVYGISGKYTYSVRVALLDLEDPRKVIAHLPYQLFKPANDYELSGIVNKVCFPTGTALFGDTLYIYYGAADQCIACASLSLSSLLGELVNVKIQNKKACSIKIKSIQHLTHNVLKIVTEKPPAFDFYPGQAAEISINKNGWENELRPFTFTSLPNENHLEFTIKTYPSHKGVTKQLLKLVENDEFILHEVFGTITYKGEGVFIAGGAGVTPFICIFRYLKSINKIGNNVLIFANRTKADIILQQELKNLLGKNFINILSQDKVLGYAQGRITKQFLKANVSDFSKKFYLCGPESMIDNVEKQLYDLGVNEKSIVKEEF
ncbi:glycosidase related protein [Pseudopedobacter saltans DSM 12145]|uniref:Glycosidase related protein n=1 Tax=Pseudopedobacter saltans (strain ATCC 51119 / DSM 12145 / JCM 21818 / CCUG 39354 / LMG 10337 / NBRC 100064 / NCIMB 13643) TaxID=762903 RepID=F0SEP2_PSESL|nr:glycosidase-like protein [Pseudopedobacter saltans]ADY51932.1 glycosidase related protein [Pseudopedobacter saltans DSM 12145]